MPVFLTQLGHSQYHPLPQVVLTVSKQELVVNLFQHPNVDADLLGVVQDRLSLWLRDLLRFE